MNRLAILCIAALLGCGGATAEEDPWDMYADGSYDVDIITNMVSDVYCEVDTDEPGRVNCFANCDELWTATQDVVEFLFIWDRACGPLRIEMEGSDD